MKKALLIIDVQESFINRKALPYTGKVADAMNQLQKEYETVLITQKTRERHRFDNRPNPSPLGFTPEERAEIFVKDTMSAATEELIAYLEDNELTDIDVCGVSTDSCVMATAFALTDLGYEVNVRGEHCASIHGIKAHNKAIWILHKNGMSQHWMSQLQY